MIFVVLLAFSLSAGFAEWDYCLDENDDLIDCEFGCCSVHNYDLYPEECCTSSPTAPSPTTFSPDPTTLSVSSTSESWSTGSVVGLVVGIISVLLIVGIAVFIYWCHSRTPASVQQPTPTPANIHVNIVQENAQNKSASSTTESISLSPIRMQNHSLQHQKPLGIQTSYSQNEISGQQVPLGIHPPNQDNPTYPHQVLVGIQQPALLETQPCTLDNRPYQHLCQPSYPEKHSDQQQGQTDRQPSYQQSVLSCTQAPLTHPEGPRDTRQPHSQVPGSRKQDRQLSPVPQNDLPTAQNIVVVQKNVF